ncbi:retrotransposon-like protein 1 [Dermatophagoides farinae]|uniref:Retrotransposon-like protein 1 n=1 Tax=Dermatophagoides farinae TaxID=6954 RepID=A0A922L0T2_DERFA|nr:retrotransposon-like protein 1 [Dermatophagoides farinae]
MEQVVHEYNNSPHEATGFSPAFLLYGILPYEQFKMNNQMTIEEAREIANQHSQEHHHRNEETYNRKFKRPQFQVNDDVLVEIAWHPNNGKLTPVMEAHIKY